MEDTIKLGQHLADTNSPLSALDTSLSDLILFKLNSHEYQEALKLSHDFKCNDKRWIWLQVRSYCGSMSWAAVHTLVKDYKRLPIGWVPFLLYMSHHQVPQEYIRDWIPKASSDWRCRLYETFGLWTEAFEASKATGETEDLLAKINRKMDSPGTSTELKTTLKQLQTLCIYWISSRKQSA